MCLTSIPELAGADEALMCMAVRPPVQLLQLKLDVTMPGAVLELLDARHLTNLHVCVRGKIAAALLVRAFGTLRGLKELVLHAQGSGFCQDALARGVGSLTSVTKVAYWGRAPTSASVLQRLPVSTVTLHLVDSTISQALSHLTQLRHLTYSWLDAGHDVADSLGGESLVTSLSGLASLQQLHLEYGIHTEAVVAAQAPAWGALKALQSLRVTVLDYGIVTPALFSSGIAAATSITRLELVFKPPLAAGPGVDMETMLASLCQLQHLVICSVPSTSGIVA